MSVAAARREVGPVEFLRWQVYKQLEEKEAYENEWNIKTKQDFYGCQISQLLDILSWRVASLWGGGERYCRKGEEFLAPTVDQAKAKALSAVAGVTYSDRAEGATDEEYREFRTNKMKAYVEAMLSVGTGGPPPGR